MWTLARTPYYKETLLLKNDRIGKAIIRCDDLAGSIIADKWVIDCYRVEFYYVGRNGTAAGMKTLTSQNFKTRKAADAFYKEIK